MSGEHNELSRGSFLAFNAVAQQANDLDQNHPLSMRMLIFVGLAQAFFVLNIFNALLVSSLANESVDYEVASLQVGILIAISGKPLMNLMFFPSTQDVYQGGYNLAVWRGTFYEHYFSSAEPDSIQGKLWRKIIKGTTNRVKNNQEGLNLMMEVSHDLEL